MKRFKEFINEGAMDYLKPKSEEEIRYIVLNNEDISKEYKILYILEHGLDYKLLPRNSDGHCVYNDMLDLRNKNLTELPDNFIVTQSLYISNNKLTELPENLSVGGDLNCRFNKLTKLPKGLQILGDLKCDFNLVKLELPEDAIVRGKFYNEPLKGSDGIMYIEGEPGLAKSRFSI